MSTTRSLKHLVYVSSAARPFTDDELVDILRVSRRNNAAAGVTGALLYAGGNIMQVLEGPADAVDAVYARVVEDRRHHGSITLLDQEITQRDFADWAMGFLDPDALTGEDREAARSLYALTERPLGEVPSGAARRLLGTFRNLLPGQRAHIAV